MTMNLFPIRFLKGDPPYNATEIAGFPIALARQKVRSGLAEWLGETPPEALELDAQEAAVATDARPAVAAPVDAAHEAPKEAESPADPTPIPADFPCRKALVAAGIKTLGGIPRVMDDLMAVDGIGFGFAKKILSALED